MNRRNPRRSLEANVKGVVTKVTAGSGDAGIAFVLSTPGQNILLKYGFLPLS